MSASGFLFKRGDSFAMTAVVFSDGIARDLAGAQVGCQLRDATGALVAAIQVTVDPRVIGCLHFGFSGDTRGWPLSTLRADVAITWPDDTVNTTETFAVTVVDRVTQ